MGASLFLAAVVTATGVGQTISQDDVETQNAAFQRWWATDFVWKFDELPTETTVAAGRVPYSGYIYPDTAGGTISALRKYDRAFNGGRLRATGHEQWDTTAYRKPQPRRGGLFGFRTVVVMSTPHWHGHCNGWAAAAIRHAEPKRSVRANGVVFTPADIKALLAEIYMYNDTEMLAGDGSRINPGVLHTIITNWLGRGKHPVAMEADPGEEKWNYPIYAYSTTSAKRSNNRVEVKMNLAYANSSNREYHESPRYKRVKYFHYELQLDDEGQIVGGWYYRDSSRIDMLWIPLQPKPGGQEGNQRGNPHVDVKQVLAIWRASVDDDVRHSWAIIDPPEEDRLVDAEELAQIQPAAGGAQPAAEDTAATTAAAETATAETETAAGAEATSGAETETSGAETETSGAETETTSEVTTGAGDGNP